MLDKLYTGEKEFLGYQEHFGMKNRSIMDLVRFDPPEMEYTMSGIPIGYIKNSDRIFKLDMTKSKRILIIGASGSGKSVLTNTIIDRFIKSGGVVSIFDLKGEYIYKDRPLDDKWATKTQKTRDGDTLPTFLFPSEKPQGFPIVAYYPKFLYNQSDKSNKILDKVSLCQFGLDSIKKEDFFTFFELLTKNNTKYFDILEELWNAIETESFTSWDDIVNYIENHKEILGGETSTRSINRAIRILKDNEVIGDQYDAPDMVKDILENKLSILCLRGLLKMPAAMNPALVYVKILLRKIYDSKADGTIPKRVHNLINLDEVGKFVGRLGESPSRDEFLKLLDLARSERISLLYAAQDFRRIPSTLIQQANYIFISYNSTLDDMAEIIKMILPGEYDVPQTFRSRVAELQRMMKKYSNGKRDWFVINKDEKNRTFITPVLPLSHFQQESDEN